MNLAPSSSCAPLSACAVAITLALAGCAAGRAEKVLGLAAGDWILATERTHPLVGRIFDVGRNRFVTEEELGAALDAADIVFLGEQHDNVDHHRLQARLLENLVARKHRPAVAFEQLDFDKQAAVDRALSGIGTASAQRDPAATATALASAVDWARTGWPPFDQYRPVFEAALRAGLPVRAANLPRSAMMDLFSAPGKAAAAKPGAAVTTCHGAGLDAWRDVPLTGDLRASMVAEIQESHCGYADDRLVDTMLAAQRRRDDAMAAAVSTAFIVSERAVDAGAPARATDGPAARPGVVVICGFAHARKDFGVPLYLRSRDAGRAIVTVGFVEAFADGTAPSDYAAVLHAAHLPFDYVIFTPRVDNADPCEKYRAGLQKMKKR